MKRISLIFIMLGWIISLHASFSFTHDYSLRTEDQNNESFIWKKENITSFNELLLSWNAKRPKEGSFLFLVRVKTNEWSPWMRYAEWGKETQLSFSEDYPDSFVKIFQDTLNTQEGKLANAFEIKVVCQGNCTIKELNRLYVTTSDLSLFSQSPVNQLDYVLIKNISGQSQMILNHPRHKDMCSPTSTSTVINFLLKKREIDPVCFASRSKDMGFDIYGNWALNVAEAYNQLKGNYFCHIERLDSFAQLHSYLLQNLPVVVSVKGEIPGAHHPYKSGHLMVVIGYDPKTKRVHCIDSAFESNENTMVSYAIEDFLKAWGIRKNLAYIFTPRF